MSDPAFHRLSSDLYCIDALYTGPGIACCYLLGDGREYALIETGTARSVPNVLATLDSLQIDRNALRYIIPTHVHLDHAGGAGQLLRALPQAEVLIHPRGARHLEDPTRLTASARGVYGDDTFQHLYGEVLPVPGERLRALDDGARIHVGQRELRVKHLRGHAEHHFCLFDELSRGWFSGDMFGVSYPALRFADRAFVMPATTPTQFDPAAYLHSVDQLAQAKPQQIYLTHYGALQFRPEQAELLKQQLRAYMALAAQGERNGDALQAAVLDITRSALQQLVDADSAERIAATLTMDAQLNAQGIAWWMAKSAG